MKKLMAMAALALLLASCGHATKAVRSYHARDYQWHKNTPWLKLHWNYKHPGKGTIVAEGYVEPFNPRYGLHGVNLELVGLDEGGNVVNEAAGRPEDSYIASPYDTSPFRITMRLNGREKGFTIKGSYYHYVLGEMPDFDSRNIDYIPLVANEPY